MVMDENAKVILQDEVASDAYKLCEELKNQAIRIGPGSGAVDRIEWKAASVIRQLLYERSELRRKLNEKKKQTEESNNQT